MRRESSMTEAASGRPARVDAGLEIFGKPSVAADPGEEPLDHPSARQNGKADQIRLLATISSDMRIEVARVRRYLPSA